MLFGFISLILAVIIFTFPKKIDHSSLPNSASNSSVGNTSNGKKNKKLKKNGLKHKNGSLKHENELVSLNSNHHEESENKIDLKLLNGTAKNVDGESLSKNHEHQNEFLTTLETTGSLLSINKLGIKSSRIDLTNLNEEDEATNTLESSQSANQPPHSNNLVKDSLSLLKNPVYVLIIIATTIEGLLQNSFLAFAALFLEYQYRLASGTASFVLGLLSIPPLMIGGILSGIIVKRLKYRANDCLKFLGIVLLVNILVYSGFMIYCKEPNMIPNKEQLDIDYEKTMLANQSGYTIASNCNCNRKIFKPVCLKHSDDIFFQSACLAGCNDFDKATDFFTNCTQEMDSYLLSENRGIEESHVNYFVSGLCPTKSCYFKLVISYMCIFFLMLLNALTFLPYLKVTIGSINSKEMNPIGLGMKQFFMNGLGN